MDGLEMTAGYSGTPLVKKLGIKSGMRVMLVNAPADYMATLGDLPPGVELLPTLTAPVDFIQWFTNERADLQTRFPVLKAALAQNGMLWVSWYKKAAKLPTELDENFVRDTGLATGLVDVKIAAVDELWSGLKFVYRVADRKG